MRALIAAALLLGCGRISFSPFDGVADATGADAPPCELGPWGAPSRIVELATADRELGPKLSPDGRTLYFHSDRVGGEMDLYAATRPTAAMPFGAAMPVTAFNTSALDADITFAGDGTVYFASTRSGPVSIFVAASISDVPQRVAELGDAGGPGVRADNLEMFLSSGDILVSRRASTSMSWSIPMTVPELSSVDEDGYIDVAADGLSVVFESKRAGASDVYLATRPDRSAPFSPPVPFVEINSTSNEADPSFSADGRALYFGSDRGGDYDLYVTTRQCM